eukprot:g76287.t1
MHPSHDSHCEPLISGRKECCVCQSPCTNKQSLTRAFDPANNLEVFLEQRCSIAHRRSVLSYIQGKKFGRLFAPLPNVAPFPFVQHWETNI